MSVGSVSSPLASYAHTMTSLYGTLLPIFVNVDIHNCNDCVRYSCQPCATIDMSSLSTRVFYPVGRLYILVTLVMSYFSTMDFGHKDTL